jgi:hypothetical protein
VICSREREWSEYDPVTVIGLESFYVSKKYQILPIELHNRSSTSDPDVEATYSTDKIPRPHKASNIHSTNSTTSPNNASNPRIQ